jgi:quercetin dioxygenase-like cupin family protein
MLRRIGLCLAIMVCALALGNGPAAAQQQDIKRTILQKVAVPGTNDEAVLGIAEIAPNASFARHTHPGPEATYMLEGGMTLNVEGKPAMTLKPGDSYQLPPGTVHSGQAGSAGAKVLAVWVVPKGQPLAIPAK